MLCEHHIKNTLSLQFAKIIQLLADLNVERIKFQSASANLSRNYNATTMSKSLVFHCTWAERNETSGRIDCRSISINPFPKPIENDALNSGRPQCHHIASDWSNRCNSALTLRALKMSKIKNLKRSNFGQSVFFRAQNALCGKTGGAIIGLRVSKQDGMAFSLSPTCLSFVGVNPFIPTQF
jgi:hypothetical protein